MAKIYTEGMKNVHADHINGVVLKTDCTPYMASIIYSIPKYCVCMSLF